MIRSSYAENNYAEVFRSMVMAYRPPLIVECGVLDGYSTLALGRAAKKIKKYQVNSHVDAYDLWGAYPFKHGEKAEVQARIDEAGIADYVTLKEGDAYDVYQDYADRSISMLHIDISNTGETIRKIMELWDPKIDRGGVICFEGGTEERDNVDWMLKYGKEPIKPEIENNKLIHEKYVVATYLSFPGLTMLLKKRL